jgi:hypothetical protein
MSPREPLAVVRVELPRCPHCESLDIVRRTGRPMRSGTHNVRYMRCNACGRTHVQIVQRKEKLPQR